MGICYSLSSCTYSVVSNEPSLQKESLKKNIAFKFPHGVKYMSYDDEKKSFIKDDDVNDWIEKLYKDSKLTNWVIYNDEPCSSKEESAHIACNSKEHIVHDDTNSFGNIKEHHPSYKKGHCKGIVAWDDTRISWLCHSLPLFPSEFNGTQISKIAHAELMYAQSFQYIEIDFSKELIFNVLQQLHIMDACVYLEKYTSDEYNFKKMAFNGINTFSTIKLSDNVSHIAKSPFYEVDFYSDILAKEYKFNWSVESWLRGHLIETVCENVTDVKEIKFEDITYKEHQDHSKFAVSDDAYYFVGDLNRMTTQFRRGGGGFICKDLDISKCLLKIV